MTDRQKRIQTIAMPTASSSFSAPLRRKCECSEMRDSTKVCEVCNENKQQGAANMKQSAAELHDLSPHAYLRRHGGHDFGKVRIHFTNSDRTSLVNDQTPSQSGGLDDKFMQGAAPEPTTDGEPKQDINLGADETKAPALPIVDSVEMVTSSTGAVGGFPEIECLASLNQPGPYNDQAFRGSVANVHQVHFHLSQGYPGDLRATRMVNRTSLRRGMNFPKSGNDGPPDHEYRYTKDKMVIADAPGWCKTLTDPDFPVNYKADFSMYAWDAPTKKILASISYHVEIEKTHYSQPGPVNTVTVTATKIGGAVKSPVIPKKEG